MGVSCKEEGRLDHIDMSAPAPEQVYDVTVKPTPGGAILKYKMPKDENLLYVKAVYQIETGACGNRVPVFFLRAPLSTDVARPLCLHVYP